MKLLLLILFANLLWAQDTLRYFNPELIKILSNDPSQSEYKASEFNFQKYSPQIEGFHQIEIHSGSGIDFKQNLDLRLFGPLDSVWQIEAQIKENDLPLGKEGISIPLQEIDQIGFEVYSPTTYVKLGDNTLRQPNFSTLPSTSWLGIQQGYKNANWGYHWGWGQIRSNTILKQLRISKTQQTAYAIYDAPILPGSEIIIYKERILKAGRDYQIEYSTGLLSFLPFLTLGQNEIIEVSFKDYQAQNKEIYTTAAIEAQNNQNMFYAQISTNNREIDFNSESSEILNYRDSLRNKGIFLDTLNFDSLTFNSSLIDSINLSQWYFKQNEQWISLQNETPLKGKTIFKLNFIKDPSGNYEPYIVSRPNLPPIKIFKYKMAGGYLAATPIEIPLDKKSWNIEWNSDYENFGHELTWRGNNYSDNPKSQQFIDEKIRLGSKNNIHFILNHSLHLGNDSTLEPQINSFIWTKDWGLEDSTRLKTDWLLNQISINLPQRLFIKHSQWIHQFNFKVFDYLNDFSADSTTINDKIYRSGYALEKKQGLWQSLFSTDYLFQEHKESNRFLNIWNQEINYKDIKPYQNSRWMYKPYQDFLEWNNTLGVSKKQNTHTIDLSVNHLGYGHYNDQKQFIDSTNQIIYQLNSTYTPNAQQNHELSLSYQNLKQLQNTEELWQAQFKRTLLLFNEGFKENFYYRHQGGYQQALIANYEKVPDGTGDALYDTLTQQWINDLDHGNYVFVGMIRDSLSQPQKTSDLEINWNILLEPQKIFQIRQGFLKDISLELNTDIFQRDSSLNHFHPFGDDSHFFEEQSQYQYRVLWKPSDYEFNFNQKLKRQKYGGFFENQFRSIFSGIELKKEFQRITPRLFASQEEAKQNLLTWDFYDYGSEILIKLPFDFSLSPLYKYSNYQGSISNLKQQFYQLQIDQKKEYYQVSLNSKWIFSQSQGNLPYLWHRGFKNDFGHEYSLSLSSPLKSWLNLESSAIATQYELKSEWFLKINFFLKGEF